MIWRHLCDLRLSASSCSTKLIDVAAVSALKIHISENSYEAIKTFREFITEPRGEIYVKVIITVHVDIGASGNRKFRFVDYF